VLYHGQLESDVFRDAQMHRASIGQGFGAHGLKLGLDGVGQGERVVILRRTAPKDLGGSISVHTFITLRL
jgi:hypothetical protein